MIYRLAIFLSGMDSWHSSISLQTTMDSRRNNKRNKKKNGRRQRNPRESASRALTSILRHNAIKRGLQVRPDGFVKVNDLLKLRGIQSSLKELQQITAECDKQRFKMALIDGVWFIRANQGHTMEGIDPTQLLQQIFDPAEIPICIHGTYMRYWNSIQETGLSKMQRHHIHFTSSEVQNEEARSGFRKSCDLLIFVDTQRAMEDGCLFFKSDNNVILSPGFDGIIPSQYFSCVRHRHTGEIIFQGDSVPGSRDPEISS